MDQVALGLGQSGTHGYWLVGSDGGIFTFGSAQFYGSTGALTLQRPVVGITPTSDLGGYWLVASDGGVFTFGDAGFFGSIPGLGFAPAGSGAAKRLNAPIVGMVPSSDGGGYFMVGSDGGVFAFGDAKFEGSCPGIGGCSGAAVTVMPDATGNGYWLVTATGHIYTFGDAAYYGAPGPQNVPVTSAVRTAGRKGLLDSFLQWRHRRLWRRGHFGSPTGVFGGQNPATAIFATADGQGYWVASANGSVYTYGDAPVRGVNGRHQTERSNHRSDGILAAAGGSIRHSGKAVRALAVHGGVATARIQHGRRREYGFEARQTHRRLDSRAQPRKRRDELGAPARCPDRPNGCSTQLALGEHR